MQIPIRRSAITRATHENGNVQITYKAYDRWYDAALMNGLTINNGDTVNITTTGIDAFSINDTSADLFITPVNQSPTAVTPINLNVLQQTGSMTNAVNPEGETVATLLGTVTDSDSTDNHGIAVNAVDNSNGTWQYLTDNESLWRDFNGLTNIVDNTNTTLLSHTAKLRFIPDDGNTTGGNVTFHVWDQTSTHTNGQTGVDISSSLGGSNAFKSTSDSLSVTVTDNSGDNTIQGDHSTNTLVGGAGGDTLVGGQGDDKIYADGRQFSNNLISNMKLWLDAADNKWRWFKYYRWHSYYNLD